MRQRSETVEFVKKKGLESEFEPSMKTLVRILKIISEHRPETKTQLSLIANLNYARLAKHIDWLEKKGIVKPIIEDNKINITMTTSGKIFASIISKIN